MPAQTRSGAKASLSKNTVEAESSDAESVTHALSSNSPSLDTLPSSEDQWILSVLPQIPDPSPATSSPQSPPPQSPLPPPPQSPPPPPPTSAAALQDLNPRDALLQLRKTYKRTAGLFHKARHHFDFLRECTRTSTVPKGLPIRITCLAAAKHLNNVTSHFDDIISQAERDLLSALVTHYRHLCDHSSEETKAVLKNITSVINRADSPTILAHTQTMKLTEANLDKRRNALVKRSHKKIEDLPKRTQRLTLRPSQSHHHHLYHHQLYHHL